MTEEFERDLWMLGRISPWAWYAAWNWLPQDKDLFLGVGKALQDQGLVSDLVSLDSIASEVRPDLSLAPASQLDRDGGRDIRHTRAAH